MPFEGFSANETFSPLPDTFFRRLLAEIDDLDELKVTLYALWRLTAARGTARFLREEDFAGCGAREVASGLQRAVGRGTLLQVEHESGRFYFLNSPYGRLAAEALRSGRWHPASSPSPPPPPINLFQLYEDNIGPLTPILADAIQDAENTYSTAWVAEAIAIAAKRNKRNWKYIESILKRWEAEGRAEKQDRGDIETDRRTDVRRKVEQFLRK
jgi:DNA replication protein